MLNKLGVWKLPGILVRIVSENIFLAGTKGEDIWVSFEIEKGG